MQEKFTGRLLKDGHLTIPKEIIDKLKIDKGSKLQMTVLCRVPHYGYQIKKSLKT